MLSLYLQKRRENFIAFNEDISYPLYPSSFTLYVISCVKFYYTFIKFSEFETKLSLLILIPHLVTGTCFSKHVRSNCVFQVRTIPGRETSCASCKTSGRHSFWRLTSLALLAREHETRDRRAADHTDRGASHHSFIGDSPARSSYPNRISPPCPDGEGGTVGDRSEKKRKKKRKRRKEK